MAAALGAESGHRAQDFSLAWLLEVVVAAGSLTPLQASEIAAKEVQARLGCLAEPERYHVSAHRNCRVPGPLGTRAGEVLIGTVCASFRRAPPA